MKLFNSKVSKDRPSEQTPFGHLYTDTPAYAEYLEACRIRDWHETFLDDMERLRLNADQAIKRIDDFVATLPPSRMSISTIYLAPIRECLSGNTDMKLAQRLNGLRHHTWVDVAGSFAQHCERVPNGQEIAYSGPFPREPGSHTPAYGYHRAMADGRY